MREILFRAKRIDTGEWVVGLPTIVFGLPHIVPLDNEKKVYQYNSDTLCQYTGIEDKSGRKIYEGDILKAYLDDAYPDDDTVAIIVWNKLGWYIKEKGSADYMPVDESDIGVWEVIGNASDNANLMEEGRSNGYRKTESAL